MIFDQMETDVLPRLKKLRHQVIHQDAHTHNLLVNQERTEEVIGLIDFGDMVYGPLICELAVAASSFVCEDLSDDPIQVMGELAEAYDRVLPLEAEEIDLLYDLVLARQAMNITITEMRKTLYPDDAPHIDLEEGLMDKIAQNIEHLLGLGRVRVTDGIRAACHFPPYFPAEQSDEEGLIARRQRLMGKHATHFYKQPLHLERGEGVWLYGADGRRYLDCYNNIPTVGHGHPQVIQAITRQASALNTHTRYLYRAILDYTEKLTNTLPDHLTACILVNSGSEANDVAFQIAQFITGKRGAVIMRDAYHGITQSIIALFARSPGHPACPPCRGVACPRHLYRTLPEW
ncbi:MAG: aminotransferase class III-fold pyridoxal phosphate-dependent enzyme [Anaerolineae bacterium]|nr:aminotransferase class III-fold pyridoxal phosphate-dependent enzyme [Anaerolineae bacterium]